LASIVKPASRDKWIVVSRDLANEYLSSRLSFSHTALTVGNLTQNRDAKTYFLFNIN